jgi:hypothetical protein
MSFARVGGISFRHCPFFSSSSFVSAVAAAVRMSRPSRPQVVRFDRRVPMRQRWRAAGDNPAWRGFVPQWTAEGGAHRIWMRKTAERARLLHSFNEAVGNSAEKPPELEAGKL